MSKRRATEPPEEKAFKKPMTHQMGDDFDMSSSEDEDETMTDAISPPSYNSTPAAAASSSITPSATNTSTTAATSATTRPPQSAIPGATRSRPLFIPSGASAAAAAAQLAAVTKAQEEAQQKARAKEDAERKKEERARALDQEIEQAKREKEESQARAKREAEELKQQNKDSLKGKLTAQVDDEADEMMTDQDQPTPAAMEGMDLPLSLIPSAQSFSKSRASIPLFFFKQPCRLPNTFAVAPSSALLKTPSFRRSNLPTFDSPWEYLNWVQDNEIERFWSTYDESTKNDVRQLLWQLSAYCPNMEVQVRAFEKLQWCVKQEVLGKIPKEPIFPLSAIQLHYSEQRCMPSRTRNGAVSAWIPRFHDLLEACRCWGGALQPESKSNHEDQEVDGRCSHSNFVQHTKQSALFFEATQANELKTIKPTELIQRMFPHGFTHTLTLFGLHLSFYSHQTIFTSMCQRHDFILLILQITLDTIRRSEYVQRFDVWEKLIDLVCQGIEDEANQQSRLPTSEQISGRAVSDQHFLTLAGLFISPLLNSSPAHMADMIRRLRDGAKVHSFKMTLLRAAAMALARSIATDQPVSLALLTREVSTDEFVKLTEESPYLKRVLPTLSEPTRQDFDRIRAIGQNRTSIVLGTFLLDSEPSNSSLHETRAFLKWKQFLDEARILVGTVVEEQELRELKEEIEMHLSFMSSLHMIHHAILQLQNRPTDGEMGDDASATGSSTPPTTTTLLDPKQTVLLFKK